MRRAPAGLAPKTRPVIGFTGTREGMDRAQVDEFVTLVTDLQPTAFHFGDCLGADAGAFALVVKHLKPQPGCLTVAHPPTQDILRAWCEADIIREPEQYAVRNEAIVAECDLLVAAPLERFEVLRSGTWMTIRMARRAGKPVHLLLRGGQ